MILAGVHLYVVVQRTVDDVERLLVVADERRRSDPAIGEVMHSPGRAAIHGEGTRLRVDPVEPAQCGAPAGGDRRLVAKSEARRRPPCQASIGADDAHRGQAALHRRVIAVA